MYSVKFILLSSVLAGSRRLLKREESNTFPAFHVPEGSFNLVSKGSNGFTSDFLANSVASEPKSREELRAAALKWANNNFQTSEGESIEITSGILNEKAGIYNCYLIKTIQGVELVNSMAQLTMSTTGEVISAGKSWVSTDGSARLLKRDEGISCKDAVMKVANSLKIVDDGASWVISETDGKTTITGIEEASGNVTCTEKMYQTSASLNHVHEVIFPTPDQYLSLMVDKASGVILGASDFSSNFAMSPSGRLLKRQAAPKTGFRALQLGAIDPQTVPPSFVENPEDPSASPKGWFNGKSETSGPNVIAVSNREGLRNPNAIANNGKTVKGNNFQFDVKFDDTKQQPSEYTDASVINAFFVTNRLHDILLRYGFDEESGNFQKDNFGKGGLGNDEILAVVQDGTGRNNANFASPADGTSGIMRMFIFDGNPTDKDGALENAVVIHEIVHGVSNRLTGGARNPTCLQTAESGGMGEGWSDMFAIALEMESVDTRETLKAVGQYATGNKQSGVRQFGYSTNMNVNPLTYGDLPSTGGQVHQVGEVWASALFEVYWNMVDKNGFDINFRTNPDGNNGNNQFLKLLIQGMKSQPCNPTFINARDAIFEADRLLFNGANTCEIAKGFAKRGLGINARNFRNDNTLPEGC